MLTLNRILLASDVPASALAALPYAVPLARLTSASLEVLQVIDTRVAALPRWTDIFRSTEAFAALETARQEATRQLLAHPALQGLSVNVVERNSHPADAIVDAAARVDLGVVGLHGKDTPHGLQALRLLRQIAPGSPVPLLFVPSPSDPASLPPVSPDAPFPIQRMLLALHLSEYAPQAVTLALELAQACNASLQVLQVFDPQHPEAYAVQLDAGLSHSVGGVRGWLQQHLQETLPEELSGVTVERLVLEGQPAEVILKQASSSGAQLIVMSAHAYEGLQKLFHLSTVEAVWEGTTCPVLTIPLRSAALG